MVEIKEKMTTVINKEEKEFSRDFIKFYNNLNIFNRKYRGEILRARIEEKLLKIDNLLNELYEDKIKQNDLIFLNGDLSLISEEKDKALRIIDNADNISTYEIYQDIIINFKLRIIAKIECYEEKYEGIYNNYRILKDDFNMNSSNIEIFFKRELKKLINEKQEEVKKCIWVEYKNILKEIENSHKNDINLNGLNLIRDKTFNLNELNLELFTLYKEFEAVILNSFKELSLFENNHDELNREFTKKILNLDNLNKRYLKLIELYSGFGIKEKIINDINELLGADTFRDKLFIEYIYASDFLNTEYTEQFKSLKNELLEKFNNELYIKFKEKYGDMNKFSEKKELIIRLYEEVKSIDYEKLNDISLIDILNHSRLK